MRSLRSSIIAFAFFGTLAYAAVTAPAGAIPIYAQRYLLSCETCHSVLPELNEFGREFRAHGYQLPLRRHGTTVVALRYQLEYEKDPVDQRRYQPGGVLLSNGDIGRISAFIHYNLGSNGGPSAFYLAYLATYNPHTQSLYRGGLFELPLPQSPGQRLDDLQQYGYYGTHVGLNDLPLSSPRWGIQLERTIGTARLDFIGDLGEFKGAAYGGAPIPTGETSSANGPEFGIFSNAPIGHNVSVGINGLSGDRHIVLVGRPSFDDAYIRGDLFAFARSGKLEVQLEQWLGRDTNADGFGTPVGSSGGYIRAKYYPNPHAYLGIRYDTSANPAIVSDVVYYGAFQILPFVRFLLQQVQTVGGTGHFGGAITVGFPPPLKTQ